jgi:hypothetical protein
MDVSILRYRCIAYIIRYISVAIMKGSDNLPKLHKGLGACSSGPSRRTCLPSDITRQCHKLKWASCWFNLETVNEYMTNIGQRLQESGRTRCTKEARHIPLFYCSRVQTALDARGDITAAAKRTALKATKFRFLFPYVGYF